MDLATIDQLNDMLNSVLDGEESADGMPDEVQHWLLMSTANMACHVAKGETKQERQERLERVPPIFKDDVSALAKEMFNYYLN
ncbi:hypothetical protein [Pseudoalteromonas phage H103]|uniref:hypothetical protein n=1 Tax=Pseudoalteromonas phage H103 TaxID=1636200 RepID=UPI0006BCE045|nr:hypothetical protein AVU31_gp65 [Pseudoalteromonas phage H103]AKA61241.1 hypothetical protein [Pseudoalteromonas phage H103]